MQRKRFILSLLGAVFLLPFLIACGLYFFQDRIQIKTHYHGQLFHPAVPVNLEVDPLTPHWYLVYIQPTPCQATCTTSIAVIQGLHSLLGEKSLRVRKKIITPSQLSFKVPSQQVAIIDPHHNLVMLYPGSILLSNPQAIFADLKKLLSVSRIG